MSAQAKSQRAAPDHSKENTRMPKRLVTIAALIAAALFLLALLPIASALAAQPWWQVLTGSRPTNMWEPSDNVQEITSEETGGILAAKIEVQGIAIGCLGAGTFFGLSADEVCQALVGAEATETAAELETLLEGTFGTSTVGVSGGPAGGEPFHVTTLGRWEPPIELSPVFGKGSAKTLSRGGSGGLVLTLTNLGDAPLDGSGTPVSIVNELPEGFVATGVEASAGGNNVYGPVACSLEAPDEVSCTYEGELPPYEAIEVEILASLTGSPPAAGAPGKVTVSGGNADSTSAVQTVKVSSQPTPFGLEQFSAQAEGEGGKPALQAGGHPFQFTTTLQLNSGPVISLSRSVSSRHITTEQPALPRNLRFPFPAGLIGTATAMPTCRMTTFLNSKALVNECPDEAALGVSSVTLVESHLFGLIRLAVPLFNLPPAQGEPARFGFTVAGDPVIVDTSLDPDNKYRIIGRVSNVSQLAQFVSATTTLWGTPGDTRHDNARGWGCVYFAATTAEVAPIVGPCERPASLSETAFLRMPVQCASPLDYNLEVEPWNVPIGSQISSKSFSGEPLHGCNKVPFDPSIAAAPTSKLAENPSGLSFSLKMPNSNLLNKDGIAEGQPKRVEVELPEGMTLNPSAAEGLAVCSPPDYARERFDSKPGEGCPDASKLGNVSIDTPLIKGDVKGSLYIATSYDNPFNSLLALYIVARLPERGVLVKLPVKISPDPETGQLTATVDDSPQTPFNSFEMQFREGGRAPLVTPPACGNYDVVARFVPWSAQDPDNPAPNEIVTRKSTFTVQRGVDGGACPPGGVAPFKPDFEAGSINNDAGSKTAFNMRLIREDGEQNMTRFSAVLPPGVLGKLAGVSKCPDSAIAKAKARTGVNGGHEEIADPSCPASSLIGHSLVGAGVGSVLTRVPGKVYLGGAFHGDPLSVIAITPVVAGPFDVGTVVVHEALTLNPKTAEVEVDGSASDPIPHILKGIPAKLRDLRVYVDRPDFILNPTSCDESSVKSTLFGSYLDVFSPSDDRPVDLSTRYQAANCANLGFKPKLKLNLKGGTRRGGHPGLTATYTPRKGDANVKGLVVRLPQSAFLDQAHIRTICTRVQFAAKQCPKAAQYGYIKAWTPLLDEPLQGPVWLRSSSHKLPDLVFDLRGLVDVEVSTRIDSAQGGIRATLEDAPDAPLSKVVLKMQGAKKGLIVNSRNLCGGTNRANVQFSGQNGKEAKANPVMQPQCGGKRKHKGAGR
jgi:hypothetical protein